MLASGSDEAGWELRCPSRTYFSDKRLPPGLRGLQEDAVLAVQVRPRSEPAHRAVGSSPTSRRNQAAAAPQRIVTPDLRLILWRHQGERRPSPAPGRPAHAASTGHLASGGVAGTRRNGAAHLSRHRDQGCPSPECGDGAAWSSRSCRICRSDRRRSPGHQPTPERSLAGGVRVQRSKGFLQPG